MLKPQRVFYSRFPSFPKSQKEYDALFVVDAVTSLGGVELKVDDWGIDACYSGTQKVLSCPRACHR